MSPAEEIAAAKAELRTIHYDSPRANALRAQIEELKRKITQPWVGKRKGR